MEKQKQRRQLQQQQLTINDGQIRCRPKVEAFMISSIIFTEYGSFLSLKVKTHYFNQIYLYFNTL